MSPALRLPVPFAEGRIPRRMLAHPWWNRRTWRGFYGARQDSNLGEVGEMVPGALGNAPGSCQGVTARSAQSSREGDAHWQIRLGGHGPELRIIRSPYSRPPGRPGAYHHLA